MQDPVNLGRYPYGTNPLFTLVFAQKTDPIHPDVKIPTDPEAGAFAVVTGPDPVGEVSMTLTHVSAGIYTFEMPGGLMQSGDYAGTGYAPEGDGQTSREFSFTVAPTSHPRP